MDNNKRFPVILASLILLSAIALALDPETLKIMPFVESKETCAKCHSTKDIEEKFEDPAKSCSNNCMSCHKRVTEKHHKIGVKPNVKVLKDLELTSMRRVTCITCHNLKNKRYDTTAWKAESLFDGMFRRKDKYKTYYLQIKNTDGELCKKCH